MRKDIVKRIIDGDRRAAAKLITMVEDDYKKAEDFLKELYNHTGHAVVVGITGPPGSGKSTITDKLTKAIRKTGQTVAIIAIDPTSPFTGGALLGDRIRMQDLSLDKGVFIRSMGTRGYLGGLSRATQATIKILDALGKDVIFIETVGVGQAEVDIVKVADTVVLVTIPGMGDDIQIIKAGVMEIGDIFVVNKADKDGHERLLTEIQMMLDLNHYGEWRPPVIETIALNNNGIDDLLDNIQLHLEYLKESGHLKRRRHKNIKKEIFSLIQEEWKNLLTESIDKIFLDELVERIEKREIDPYTSVKKLLYLLMESYKE